MRFREMSPERSLVIETRRSVSAWGVKLREEFSTMLSKISSNMTNNNAKCLQNVLIQLNAEPASFDVSLLNIGMVIWQIKSICFGSNGFQFVHHRLTTSEAHVTDLHAIFGAVWRRHTSIRVVGNWEEDPIVIFQQAKQPQQKGS